VTTIRNRGRLLHRASLLAGLVVLALLSFGGGAAIADPDVAPGMGGNEPDTAVVNPLNPHNVVIARGGTLRISTDFGRTFPTSVALQIPPGFAAGFGSCGDSSLGFDSQGRLFWNYLVCDGPPNDVSVVVMQVDPLTGNTGAGCTPACVGPIDLTPGNNVNDDKPWIAADATPGSPFQDNLYVAWTRLGTGVQFVRSTNNGAAWSAPQTVSAGGEGFTWPSHVAVAQNGDVYVAYHSDTCGGAGASMFVLRDSTGGANLAARPCRSRRLRVP